MNRAVVAFISILIAVSTAEAEPRAHELFGKFREASDQSAASIGSYAKGCGAGFVELPETGATWQAMRLSRNRNWGHPATIAFIERLSQTAAKQPGWKGLYVGDIGQPRGGPMTSGHISHQIGLDIDIWMLPAGHLNLTRSEREEISSISVRTGDQKSVNDNWSKSHAKILKAAASDPAVDRIFVAAAAKIEMCKSARKRDEKWLRKIRPLYGHNTHFHVRMKCPENSVHCRPQRPSIDYISNGDGCDETLRWWVTGYLEELKKPKDPDKPKQRGPRDYTMQDLPGQCAGVLQSG